MKQSHNGFTLIEILIVLVIFAITFSFAVLTFGDFGKGRLARTTAEQFQSVVQYFREQAILSSTNYTIKVTNTGFQVYQSQNLTNPLNNIPSQLSSGTFPSEIIVSPKMSIEIQSTGHITPFKLTFGTNANHNILQLVGKSNGQLTIEPVLI